MNFILVIVVIVASVLLCISVPKLINEYDALRAAVGKRQALAIMGQRGAYEFGKLVKMLSLGLLLLLGILGSGGRRD